jgi:hypothetical protein
MAPALNFATLALSFIAGVFFVIGCIGYADQRAAIESVAWITSSKGGIDIYFGLSRAYVTVNDNLNLVFQYSSSDCNNEWCDECDSDGQGAFALTIIAVIFAAITAGLSGALIVSNATTLQIASAGTAFIAAVAAVVAIGLFMNGCYNAAENGDGDILSLQWGPGAILTIVGMALMWIAVLLQVVGVVTGGAGGAVGPSS